jgi:outer membrane immunogenic protein
VKCNIIVGLAVSALLIAVPLSAAGAADMPLKAPPPPPAPIWTWTGFYFGVDGGGAWSQSNTVTLTNPPTVVPGVAGPGAAEGGFGGGQIGYNWQIGQFVLGAEADVEGASINGLSVGVVDAAGDIAHASQNLDFFLYAARSSRLRL